MSAAFTIDPRWPIEEALLDVDAKLIAYGQSPKAVRLSPDDYDALAVVAKRGCSVLAIAPPSSLVMRGHNGAIQIVRDEALRPSLTIWEVRAQ